MNENTGVVIGFVIIAAGVFYAMQANASAPDSTLNIDPNTGLPFDNTQPTDISAIMTDNTTTTLDQKVSAFLAMIRQFESNNQYDILYGGSHFTDFSQHPWEHKIIHIGDHTASGAYQFILSTWRNYRGKLSLPDFSPTSQDAAAYAYLQDLGVVKSLAADNVDLAMRQASRAWASLPYSTANQNPQPLSVALNTYDNLLGVA